MNILLLGKTGQLGAELKGSLSSLGKVTAVGRTDVCLKNRLELRALLKAQAPNVVVNAAAYTAVDKAESEPDLAFQVNANAVEELADFARQSGALLVHYSTDYVFDGVKESPYVEEDEPNPQNVYGCSKRAGELAILQSRCRYLILRTSWAYSTIGSNFIKTILKLAKDKTSLQVVHDQLGAPTATELISDTTLLAIDAYTKSYLEDGIYHLTAAGVTSWYHLACYVLEKALDQGMKLQLTPEGIKPISTEEYPLLAKRPKNSRLDLTLLTSQLAIQLPQWFVHVDKVIGQLSRQENRS